MECNTSVPLKHGHHPTQSTTHLAPAALRPNLAPVPAPHTNTNPCRVRQAVAGAFTEGKRNVRTEVFGSYVNGLATWQSDIDLVVTGLHKPHPVKGGGSDCGRREGLRTGSGVGEAWAGLKMLGC